MKTKPLISIIVPVFNVEKYLSRCLDSILAQTFSDFEVIAVNDGSPDNCGKILDEYALKDERIKVIHKENGGVSSARNAGLDAACGKYIGFVDPDDMIFSDMYEKLYNEAVAGNYDIVQCGCIQVNESDEVIHRLACDENKEYTDTNDALCALFENIIIGCVWNKIYKFDVVKNVRFLPEIRVAEDVTYVHDCLLKAEKVKLIGKCGYRYFLSPLSAVRSKASEKTFDNFIVLDRFRDLYVNNVYVFNSFKKYSAWLILSIFPCILASGSFAERIPVIAKRLVDLKSTILKGNFSKKEKIFTLMLCIAPKMTCKLFSLYLKK